MFKVCLVDQQGLKARLERKVTRDLKENRAGRVNRALLVNKDRLEAHKAIRVRKESSIRASRETKGQPALMASKGFRVLLAG